MKYQVLQYLSALLIFVFFNIGLPAQNAVGIELQTYPTGIIPGLRWQNKLSDHVYYSVRAGCQWIRHRDLGVHDDERGRGFGFSLGIHRRILDKWAIGLRADLWWNKIDWRDGKVGPDAMIGYTDITVLQPTVVLAYNVHECNHWMISPTIAFGAEWNIKTKGRPTGEGAIVLLGLEILRKI